MQPYTSSKIIITTRLIITAVAVTVTLILDRPAGDELMANAAAVEIRYMMTPKTIANVSPIWKLKTVFYMLYKALDITNVLQKVVTSTV